jgi:hypothetical protein
MKERVLVLCFIVVSCVTMACAADDFFEIRSLSFSFNDSNEYDYDMLYSISAPRAEVAEKEGWHVPPLDECDPHFGRIAYPKGQPTFPVQLRFDGSGQLIGTILASAQPLNYPAKVCPPGGIPNVCSQLLNHDLEWQLNVWFEGVDKLPIGNLCAANSSRSSELSSLITKFCFGFFGEDPIGVSREHMLSDDNLSLMDVCEFSGSKVGFARSSSFQVGAQDKMGNPPPQVPWSLFFESTMEGRIVGYGVQSYFPQDGSTFPPLQSPPWETRANFPTLFPSIHFYLVAENAIQRETKVDWDEAGPIVINNLCGQNPNPWD